MTTTDTPGPGDAAPGSAPGAASGGDPGAAPAPTLLSNLVTGTLLGAALAALVVGVIIGENGLWGSGAGFFLLITVVGVVSGRRERARRPEKPAKRMALAMIESRRATSGEMADIPVEFDVTVAPDDRPAYRVTFHQSVNLVDVADFPPRRVVVVEYPAHEPWACAIVTRPDPEWARRAADASIDSAPASTRVKNPHPLGAYCLTSFLAFLVGAAVVVLLFRAELLGGEPGGDSAQGAGRSGVSVSTPSPVFSTSTSTSTTRTSASLLEDGQMRATAEALFTSGVVTATEFRIEEHLMSAQGVGATGTDSGEPPIVLPSLPYDRLPALVREARATSGLGSGQQGAWRIDFGHDSRTKALVIRVTVTDAHGSATLLADIHGDVTQPAAVPTSR
ncbi:hypothetical protein AB0O07_18380 [Streptomyces sp. NPDC093085]|uniref:hypothetical protein n=1 Tax=Streptomyces sp. NPDC093085 TaxID=3155068 RepID=UPI0034188D83